MYAALWRILPGPWWVRLFILLLLIAGVVYGLIFFVFPYISLYINPQESTIE